MESKSEKNEYIEINISRFFIFLYKNIITLVISLVILTVIISGYIFYKKNASKGVVSKQMIQMPAYFDGSQNLKVILNYNLANVLLQNILSQMKRVDSENKLLVKTHLLYPMDKYEVDIQRQIRTANGQNSVESKKIVENDNYLLKQKYDDQKMYFTLLTLDKKSDINSVKKIYQEIMQKFSESETIKEQAQLWKKSIENTIKQSSEKLADYTELLKQDEKYLKELMSKETNTSVVDSQTQAMVVKYVTTIDNLKKQIFSLQQSINTNKLKLSSANLNVTSLGGITVEPKVLAISKKILLGSMFIIIFGSLSITIVVSYLRKIISEDKKNSCNRTF